MKREVGRGGERRASEGMFRLPQSLLLNTFLPPSCVHTYVDTCVLCPHGDSRLP